MKTKSRIGSCLSVLALLMVLTIGCSTESGGDKETTNNTDKSVDASDSKAPNSSDSANKLTADPSADKGDGQDKTPAEPISAESFPKPENAETPMYTSDTNTILFHQEGTVDDQAKFYTEQLEKLGWKKDPSSEVSDGVAFLDFSKGSLSITLTINPLREGKITTIAQGNGLSVPESLEQDDAGEDGGDDGN